MATHSSTAFVQTLQATATQPGGPVYIAVCSVGYDYQLPLDPRTLNIPGLLFCQVIAEGAERTLLTVWQSGSHYTNNKALLDAATHIVECPAVVRRGFQGQTWSKDSQQTWVQYIWTWRFYVNFLAVCGVVGGLYAFFQPIVDSLLVFPQLSAVSPDLFHEVVEGYPSTLSVQVRNDSFSGTCDLDISGAYLTDADGNYSPDALPPIKISSTKKIARIKYGDSTAVGLDFPQLDPGQYRLFVKVRQDAGLIWRLFCGEHRPLEVRQVRVNRMLEVVVPEKMEILPERNGKVSARYNLSVTPGVNCVSISGVLTLDSGSAQMTAVRGIDYEKQRFSSETRDLSGVEWTVKDARANKSIMVPVVVEGRPDTDWSNVRSSIKVFPLKFIKKE